MIYDMPSHKIFRQRKHEGAYFQFYQLWDSPTATCRLTSKLINMANLRFGDVSADVTVAFSTN